MTGDALERECPVCFSHEWEIDYMRTDDGEMQVDTCVVCGWPPPSPHGVKEYRDKWAVAGETSHSHPLPATLRHAAYLADRVEALVEVARAARLVPHTHDERLAEAVGRGNGCPLCMALARLDKDTT